MDSERDSQVQTLLKFLCVFLLVVFLVPQLFGFASVPLEVKIRASEYLTRNYDPFPQLPDFPSISSIDYSSFWSVLSSSATYLRDLNWSWMKFMQWQGLFVKWLFSNVSYGIKLLRVYCLNYVPPGLPPS